MPKPTRLDNPNAVFVIHRGDYWRPLSRGYTNHILDAGVYEPFEPWRDDEVVAVEAEMEKHQLTEPDRACLLARSVAALEKHAQEQK